MEITKEQIVEAVKFFVPLFAAVYCFGKIVESQRDVDKDWEEYIRSFKKK